MFLCIKKKTERFHVELIFWPYNILNFFEFPGKVCVLLDNHLRRIKLELGKKEFSTGLAFVALSRVRTSDGIMNVDRLDFSRVQKLGGTFSIGLMTTHIDTPEVFTCTQTRMAQRAPPLPAVLNNVCVVFWLMVIWTGWELEWHPTDVAVPEEVVELRESTRKRWKSHTWKIRSWDMRYGWQEHVRRRRRGRRDPQQDLTRTSHSRRSRLDQVTPTEAIFIEKHHYDLSSARWSSFSSGAVFASVVAELLQLSEKTGWLVE